MTASPDRPQRVTAHEQRRSARFAAVQALYQMELAGVDAETVVREFIQHRFHPEPEHPDGYPDQVLFRAIVDGVPHHQAVLDRAIAAALSANWRLQRIDSILRAILRAAAFELVGRPDTPARVVIDEYIEIARRFSDEEQCAFVNAVLDRIAHAKREAEFSGTPNGETPP